MNIDIDTLARMLDRFGFPAIILAGIFWLSYRLIIGPCTRLADKLGDGAMGLAKSGSAFLANLTASLERSHVEHVEMRAHVTAEAVAVREHVSASTAVLRDRLSSAENLLSGEVRAVVTGQFPVSTTTPPLGIQATPREPKT
jgi:hypothetical protein